MGRAYLPPKQLPLQKVLYGRRHGRGLRQKQRDLLVSLLPKLQIDLRHVEQFVPEEFFGNQVENIWLEIGFGDGEHLIWQAAANPNIGVIGCEPYLNGVAKLLRCLSEQELSNIRLFCEDARLLIERLPDQSVDKVFILFPDPWPKVRHRKRRIVSYPVLEQLARVLKDGAELRIATDEPSYIEWILWHFNNHDAFSWAVRNPSDCLQNPPDWPITRYQNKAIDAGRDCLFLTYKRLDRTICFTR